jgi:hypothetical protein
LLKISKISFTLFKGLCAGIATTGAVLLSGLIAAPGWRGVFYCIIFGCLFYLLGIISKEDFRWFRSLIKQHSPAA